MSMIGPALAGEPTSRSLGPSCGCRSLALGAIALAWMESAQSASIVVYDSGATEPIAPYFRALGSAPRAPAPASPPPGAGSLEALLPIHTPGLSPGPVAARTIDLPDLQRPLFLVGADERSLAWLARERAHLAVLGAVGLAVEMADLAEWHRLTEAAQGLVLLPISGTALAQRLALDHYPVLVTRSRIEQ
jgi:integrating conjugative element protein (TIGR03765 family)